MANNMLHLIENMDEFIHYNATDIRGIYSKLRNNLRREPAMDEILTRLRNAMTEMRPDGKSLLRRNIHPRKKRGVDPVNALLQQRPLPPPQIHRRMPPIQIQRPLAVQVMQGGYGVQQIIRGIRPPQQPPMDAKKRPLKPEPEIKVECGCCMADVDIKKTIRCTNNHQVCHTCIQRMTVTENAVVGKTKIGCLCMGVTCTGWYDDKVLEKVLEAYVYKFYQKNKRDAEILEIKKALGDDNIQFCRCANTGCNAYVETTEVELAATNNKLHCVYCLYDTCVECDVLYNPGHKCENGLTAATKGNSIHAFEELETEKSVCICKCKRALVKTDGCNKLTCPCSRLMCWCCKKDITTMGYGHFCNNGECARGKKPSCTKCHTY